MRIRDRYAPFREAEDRQHRHFFPRAESEGPDPLTFATPLEAANYCREDKAKRDAANW